MMNSWFFSFGVAVETASYCTVLGAFVAAAKLITRSEDEQEKLVPHKENKAKASGEKLAHEVREAVSNTIYTVGGFAITGFGVGLLVGLIFRSMPFTVPAFLLYEKLHTEEDAQEKTDGNKPS